MAAMPVREGMRSAGRTMSSPPAAQNLLCGIVEQHVDLR